MKGLVKGIIVGLVVIVVGAIILITALGLSGWSFSSDYEMKQFKATQSNTRLDISIAAGSVVTQFYDGEFIEITYPESVKFTAEISEDNGLLKFESKMKHVFVFGLNKIPQTVIKIPQNIAPDIQFEMDAGTAKLDGGTYGNVSLEVDAGTLETGNLVCEKLDCEMNAGTLTVAGATCNYLVCEMKAGTIKINQADCPETRVKVSAGSAKIKFKDAREQYNITTKVSAGHCNTNSQTGSTDKKIDVNVSAGSCNLEFGN